jgi:hypothetical protein
VQEINMRKLSGTLVLMLMLSVVLFSCGKKKPTAPQPVIYAVTLQYQNYIAGTNCLRLIMGSNGISQCNLGRNSGPVVAGDYTCNLYSVTNPGPNEVLALIVTGPVKIDRPKTLIVDGGDIYWWWWTE